MHIRHATTADTESIAAIYNDAIANTTATMWHAPRDAAYWRERLTDRPARLPALVAVDDAGQVMGYTTLSRYDVLCGYDDVAEWSLYVAAAARGQGVGGLLAEAIVKAGRDAGLHSIISRITAGNTASIRMNERVGSQYVGTLKQLGHKFGQRHDVLIYQLILQQQQQQQQQ